MALLPLFVAIVSLSLSLKAEGQNCANISQKLWNASLPKTQQVFEIDFVKFLRNGIVCNGTDPLYRYKFYSAQDAFYVKAVEVTYYFIEFNAQETSTKKLIQQYREEIEPYIQVIVSEVESWKKEGWTEPTPAQAAVDYVGFDLDAARNETNGAAKGLAAHAIADRLYLYVANAIAREWECNIYDHPYKSWIDNNVAPHLDDSYVSGTERLLDVVAANLTAAECDELEYYYAAALDYEFKFFEMVPACPVGVAADL